MDRMLYIAMSGAKETMISMANATNNLANVSTPGFQADYNQFRSMPVYGPGHPSRVYALTERPYTNMEHGSVVQTGRDLDVSIKGEGWLAVQGKDGNEAYTRRGDLWINENGLLLTGNGLPVLGNGGPIAIPPAEKIQVGADGTISIKPLGQAANELAVIDRIKLVRPEPSELVKGEDGLLRLKNGDTAPADAVPQVVSGSLESSNVNAIKEMVDMIELSRRFEMQIKKMKVADEMATAATSILKPA